MSRGKELIKNTGILMIARTSTQIVSFLLLPLYTALLTTEEYGRVDIYTSVSMIIIPFLTLQIEMGLFRYFIVSEVKIEKKKLVSSAYAMIGIMTVMISMLYLAIASTISFQYAGVLYVYYLSLTISTVMLQTCRACGDNIAFGVASFISSSLAVGLNVLFVAVFHWNVEGILLSSIIAQIVSSLFMVYRTKIYRYFSVSNIDKYECKKLLEYSAPLVFNQIASWTINYSDRIIIVLFWGEGINGIYSIANKFSNLMNTFFNVNNVAWTENVIRSMNDKDSEDYISDIFNRTFNVYLILVTGVINVLPLVFHHVINEKFWEAYQHVPILLIAMVFSGMSATIGSIYIANGKTKDVSITTVLGGICNIVVHLLLLQSFKLYAASISTLVSFAALFIYRYVFARKFIRLKFSFRNIGMQAMALFIAWIAYASQYNILIYVGLFVNLVCVALLCKKNKALITKLIRSRH